MLAKALIEVTSRQSPVEPESKELISSYGSKFHSDKIVLAG